MKKTDLAEAAGLVEPQFKLKFIYFNLILFQALILPVDKDTSQLHDRAGAFFAAMLICSCLRGVIATRVRWHEIALAEFMGTLACACIWFLWALGLTVPTIQIGNFQSFVPQEQVLTGIRLGWQTIALIALFVSLKRLGRAGRFWGGVSLGVAGVLTAGFVVRITTTNPSGMYRIDQAALDYGHTVALLCLCASAWQYMHAAQRQSAWLPAAAEGLNPITRRLRILVGAGLGAFILLKRLLPPGWRDPHFILLETTWVGAWVLLAVLIALAPTIRKMRTLPDAVGGWRLSVLASVAICAGISLCLRIAKAGPEPDVFWLLGAGLAIVAALILLLIIRAAALHWKVPAISRALRIGMGLSVGCGVVLALRGQLPYSTRVLGTALVGIGALAWVLQLAVILRAVEPRPADTVYTIFD